MHWAASRHCRRLMAFNACPICDAPGHLAIAPPRHRAMLSDGAACGVTVRRRHCRRCGAAWLPPAEADRLPRRTFGDAYTLGAAAPSERDLARARGYASRIATLVGGFVPRSLLDVGCGNGALLTELLRLWPGSRATGVEPAPRVAAAARGAGHAVTRALRPGMRASLVVSVNVIEHTADPVGFLRRLRQAVAPGGMAVVICPDASLPWLELLMADHRWSLTPAALAASATRAGFAVLRAEPAAGGFQAILLRPTTSRRGERPRGHVSPAPRRSYLAAWRALDAHLAQHALPHRPWVCFGVGEVARLLRAYAPRSWAQCVAVTADDPAGATGLGLPFLPPSALEPAAHQILLALRPDLQPRLAERFGDRFRVLAWDGLLPR